ncbi:MAG: acyltransferase family protein [Myxococcales bacterium]
MHLPALDGLRGLALVGVLLFHADGLLPGGYLGVDLFFVLSGYLITSLLLTEHRDRGHIDLAAFWVRRARRLFPALLALMPAVAVYGWVFARPEELHTLRLQALASLGYFANWHAIFDHRSYWQLFSAPSPLEHTWSLSIEEQFYLVWPLIVTVLLRRHGPRVVLGVSLLLTLLSMAAMAALFSAGATSRAYLGTDTRMAAILAGAALATLLPLGSSLPATCARWLDALGLVAAAGLAIAWCKLHGTSSFLYHGGFWLSELAALVLIACAVLDRKSLVARALSLKPLAWLGTISYGVYLWHWPVNVLLTEERTQLHGVALQLLRFTLGFAVALASYYAIERPIRRNGFAFKRLQYWVPALLVVALFLVVRSKDARGSSSAEPERLTSGASGLEFPSYRVAVFGDSTANSLGWGLRALREKGVAVELLGKDGCTMLGDSCDGGHWAEQVRALRPDATIIYLAGAFLHGLSVDGDWHTACRPDWDAKFEATLRRGLHDAERPEGRLFVVTAPYPSGRYDKPEYRAQIDCINASLRRAIATSPSARLVDLHQRLCPNGQCQQNLPNNAPLRPDGVHFSIEGAEHVARWVFQQMRQ